MAVSNPTRRGRGGPPVYLPLDAVRALEKGNPTTSDSTTPKPTNSSVTKSASVTATPNTTDGAFPATNRGVLPRPRTAFATTTSFNKRASIIDRHFLRLTRTP
jgi:hypothetical protein